MIPDHLFVYLSSALAIAMLALVLRAYLPLIWRLRDPLSRTLAVAVALLAFTKAVRSVWWDWGRVLVGDAWPAVRDAAGGLEINTAFNLLVVLAGYVFLRARLLTIPEDERDHWRWYTA